MKKESFPKNCDKQVSKPLFSFMLFFRGFAILGQSVEESSTQEYFIVLFPKNVTSVFLRVV